MEPDILTVLPIVDKLVRVLTRDYPPWVREGYFDDMVQVARIRILARIGTYDPSKAPLNHFLTLHTRWAIREYLRSKEFIFDRFVPIRGGEFDGIDSEGVDVVDTNACTELRLVGHSRIAEVLQHLQDSVSEKQWKAVKLYYFEEKTHAEIAGILGLSVGYVREIISRSLNIFREKLFSLRIDSARHVL